jgi:hypothetical protein
MEEKRERVHLREVNWREIRNRKKKWKRESEGGATKMMNR